MSEAYKQGYCVTETDDIIFISSLIDLEQS